MKFLFASDSFKGSLSSQQIGALLTKAAKQIFPECETQTLPIADGGEGTLAVIVQALSGSYRQTTVHGPRLEMVVVPYGLLPDNRAILETATVAGLPMIDQQDRDPLRATSYGLGEMIKEAMEQGSSDITITLGGSATNDGGIGALTALGYAFYDRAGKQLTGFGKDLAEIATIDMASRHPLLAETKFTLISDVKNPFTGPDGATLTYGRQKGASDEALTKLEAGMVHFQQLIADKLAIDLNKLKGAGAAGGLGGGLAAFLQANLKPGIDTVLDMLHFDDQLAGVDLVVTGEGQMDWQSAFGKVPSGVASRCRKRGIPVVAIVGGMGERADTLYEHGITSVLTTVNGIMSIETALEQAEALYENAALRMFRLLKINLQ